MFVSSRMFALVAAAAVIGVEFEASLLAELLGMPVAEALAVLETACDSHVIVRKRGGYFVHPIDGGDPIAIAPLADGEVPIGWAPDGGSLLIRQAGLPARVGKLELQRGTRSAWREFMPPDPAGVSGIPWIHFAFTAAGEAYASSHHQILSELYLVRGVE